MVSGANAYDPTPIKMRGNWFLKTIIQPYADTCWLSIRPWKRSPFCACAWSHGDHMPMALVVRG
jgi:hypothetical protein